MLFVLAACTALNAQAPPASESVTRLYEQLQSSGAPDKSMRLTNVVLHRDRTVIKFIDGIIYLPSPVAGKMRAAVFIGKGEFQAPPPPVQFEQENLRRMLKADDVSSDFKTAVLRFTDDTANELAQAGSLQTLNAAQQAVDLAAEFPTRFLKETGVNISARQLESILNRETPGVFLIQCDGGQRGRFTYIFDPQTRIPVAAFGINAGEKGLIFAYDRVMGNEVWMAFHAAEDYAKGVTPYSDIYNLVDTDKYVLTLDLMEPKKVLGMTAQLGLTSRVEGVRVLPFALGEGLGVYEDERRKRQLHILSAHLSDGTSLTFFQEPWEGGFSVVLPESMPVGQHLSLTVELKGDFMLDLGVEQPYFPRSSDTWYPRHGYLPRATFDVSIIHRKRDHAVTVGQVIREVPAPDKNDGVLTEFRIDQPIPLATFAVGPYEIHKDVAKQENGKELPLEFYAVRGTAKADFILAEMNNSIRYFSKFFGQYPYPLFRGAFHPFNYGQGFPTTIMIPGADTATNRTFSFIAHETSHQWWGDMVLWRSYRDQWLSEGFAEYSGMLYVQMREDLSSQRELIQHTRHELLEPPATLQGIAKGRLIDVGPLVMGQRLESRQTLGAYTALVYDKGALVLRMLHYLFSDPDTGDGHAFVDLMTEFVRRHQGTTATTEQFFALANERVKDTPLARKYGYTDLNWFYRQWVTQTYLPTYVLSYSIENSGTGVFLKGDLYQNGVPDAEKWFMPLPLLISFHGGAGARTAIAAQGTHTPIRIKLPQPPEKVELDPNLWILSEKTSTSKQ